MKAKDGKQRNTDVLDIKGILMKASKYKEFKCIRK